VPPELAAPDAAPRADADAAADAALAAGVREGDRRAIAKAITLLESTRADHRRRADALLDSLLPATGRALRIGISGVPGVGKSTFIETLGMYLVERGHRVAVLAVDPSSGVSGGSILGDKTRMERLSATERAYIRPSPSSGALGGVAERTREAMLVCEAAGHDVVIVETVGVGQSETTVAGMTDIFVLLQLPNAGDDLQAMKKGIMELADLIVINKADLDPDAATRAEAQITSALRVLRFTGAPGTHDETRWQTRVMRGSALKAEGLGDFWSGVTEFRALRERSGEFAERRRQQSLRWMWDQVHARLVADFRESAAVRAALPKTLDDVAAGRVAPSSAARRLLDLFEAH
jgi:LAO/AO transport system kinase